MGQQRMTSTDDKLDAILAALGGLTERVAALETAAPSVSAEEDALARQYALDPDSVCAWCHNFPIELGVPCSRCGNRAARGPQIEPPMGDVVVTTGPDGGPIFEFPVPSPEKLAARRAFEASSLGIAGALGAAAGNEDWNEHYAKAGPFWLYQHNRDLVMTYPANVRRAMVNDVAEDSPKLAYEMSRDVLKEAAGEPDLETGFGALGVGNLTTDKVRSSG